MSTASATAATHRPTVKVVNHDVPTDPKKLRANQLGAADAAILSAQTKVERQQQHLKTAANLAKARAHLKGAEQALADAIAARKELG